MRLALPLTALLLLGACSDRQATTEVSSSQDGAAPQAQSGSQGLNSPRPGLWESTLAGGPANQTVVLKTCVGPAEPGDNPFAPSQEEGGDCGAPEIQRTATGLTYTSVCRSDDVTITSRGTVTGDLVSQYSADAVITVSGPGLPQGAPTESRIRITARRTGDCPAGVEPGDLVP